MRIAYFDCFAGLSGEMLLGAMLGAGLPVNDLRTVLARLPLSGCTFDAQTAVRKELSGTRVTIAGPQSRSTNGHSHNGNGLVVTPNGQNGHADADGKALSSVACILEKSDLPDVVKETSLAIFRRLAQAEATVFPRWTDISSHSQQEDAILTVVGVVAGLSLLRIDRVECSPIHVGSGVARTAHGAQPLLSPITLEILRAASVPVYGSDVDNELVTPVGAAIITTLASAFGPLPAMKIAAVGYGAGGDDLLETSNVMRLLIGEATGRSAVITERPQAETVAPSPVSAPEAAEEATAQPTSKPFLATQEEWVTLTMQGHQQSGRQRSGS